MPLLVALFETGKVVPYQTDEKDENYTPEGFEATVKSMGGKDRETWAKEHGVAE